MYLTQGLHRAVQQQPDQLMTIFGDRECTFGEGAGRVARLAGALRELGTGEDDRVAMLSLRGDAERRFRKSRCGGSGVARARMIWAYP